MKNEFRNTQLEKHTLYKVFYSKNRSDIKVLYCESREETNHIADILKSAGFKVTVNVWGWRALIEK